MSKILGKVHKFAKKTDPFINATEKAGYGIGDLLTGQGDYEPLDLDDRPYPRSSPVTPQQATARKRRRPQGRTVLDNEIKGYGLG